MDIFSLEPLPARHGDCLILHYGPATKPSTVVIDGGPSQVYAGSLKPRLQALADARPGGPFAIDLLMVSHIDDDHINGVIEYLEAWRNDEEDGRVWPFKAKALWHNSFERIAGSTGEVQASILAAFGAVVLPPDDGDHDHETEAARRVLASVGQGAEVRKLADRVRLPRNPGFDDLVLPSDQRSPVALGALQLHVVGPLKAQVDKLRAEFAKKLPQDGQASLAAYTDESVANLSSIVVLARCGDKSILLTGDARGDYIVEGLKAQKLLKQGRLRVNILKMPHHGSIRNVEADFFKTVLADTYVASADGRHGNPDRETFETLVASRGKTARYTLHLTYEVAAIDAVRKDLHDKDVARALAKGQTKPAWDDATHSLAAFFAQCKAKGFKFKVTTPATRGSAAIDLMAPLTF